MCKKIAGLFFVLFSLIFTSQADVFAEVKEYKLDPVQSEIKFNVRATVYTIHGKASPAESKVSFDAGKGEVTLPMQVEIPVDSMTTKNKLRDRDMRKMFDSKRYPVISWTAENVECGATEADQTLTCNATGVLKIHGVEKKAVFPVLLKVESGRVLASGSLSLKREDYGLKTPSMLGLIRVSQDVHLEFRTVWTSES